MKQIALDLLSSFEVQHRHAGLFCCVLLAKLLVEPGSPHNHGSEMIPSPEPTREFQAIWNRACNFQAQREITPALIMQWATEHGLRDSTAEDRSVGRFVEIPVVLLRVGDARAIFPKIPYRKDPVWQMRRQAYDNQAALWAKVEWFCPLWVGMGDASRLLGDIQNASGKLAIELFHYHTSTLYTLPFQAVCIAQILPQPPV